MVVFTIGYQGLDFGTFLAILASHGVDTIVDVREIPISRKPGFSKTALATLLNSAGLNYVPMRELGCPKSVRDKFHQDGNWKKYVEHYLIHLHNQHEAIIKITKLAKTFNCALLCFEADYSHCHRLLVANELECRFDAHILHIDTIHTRKVTPVSSHLPFSLAGISG